MSKSHPKVIKSREQYREYMNEFMSFFGKNLDDNEDLKDRYELLGVLIQDYERKEFPPEKPSAIDAILFEMDQRGLSQKDMVVYFGSRPKVSEVLNGKRGLSKAMMKKLNSGLGIPLDILIQSADDLPEPDIGDLIKVTGNSNQEQENLQWGEPSSVGKLQKLVISVPPTCDKSVMQ
ncbi:TPA: hypothetical protein RG728_003863 [Morganella morganii subsp. morganii]|nr:hypothetical protein [Morganella morganii]DAP51126.1 MAG TPA: putative transcriptional regulator [Caudoviricetes sp.]HDU8694694.1 hypothetical protein [Morganella morganii subsp. morganii]EKW3937916.1 hypothetical protein [Morganella morganii]HCR4037757.1 hypothetical protein [Morganella morganii]